MHEYLKFKDLSVGMRICAEGQYRAALDMRATLLSMEKDSDFDEIEGLIESSDTAERSLHLLGVRVEYDDRTRIVDLQRQPAGAGILTPGTRVKTKGKMLEGQRFRAIKIKLQKMVPAAQDEIEGHITAIDPENHALTILGFRIECPPDIDVEV